MAKTEIEIELLQNPLNNQRFEYVVRDGGVAIPYIDSDNDISYKMTKRFVEKKATNLGHFSSSDLEFVLNSFNENAGFDGDVNDMVFIPRNTGDDLYIFTADNGYITADTTEYTSDEYLVEGDDDNFPLSNTGNPQMIAIIGDFSKYTYADATEVNLNRLAFIDYNRLVNFDEIVFLYPQDYMFSPTDKLNTLAFDSTRWELAIGGEFESVINGDGITVPASNLAFYSISQRDLISEKTENVVDNGGFNGEVLCVDYVRNNSLIVSGEFTDHMYTGKGYITSINTMGGLDQFFSSATTVNGVVKRFAISKNYKIYMVGEFTEVNGLPYKNMAEIGSTGLTSLSAVQRSIATRRSLFNYNTDGFDEAPNDIVLYDHTVGNNVNTYIFVGGPFSEYDGTEVGNVVKFNTNGNLIPTFNTIGREIKVNRLTINDIKSADPRSSFQPTTRLNPVETAQQIPRRERLNTLYVSGGYADDLEIGAVALNHLNGSVIEDIYFNDEVNVILIPTVFQELAQVKKPPAGSILYGGKFTAYDNLNQVLELNDVLVGATVTDTKNALLTNILDNNYNNNSVYGGFVEGVKHTYLYYDGNTITVTGIIDVLNYIKITVTHYGDDGSVIIPGISVRGLKPLLTRSDFIFRGEGGSFDNTRYNLTVYEGGLDLNIVVQDTTITKNKLTANQNNTWVNISPLVNLNNLKVHNVIEDYVNAPERITPTNQGEFAMLMKENIYNGSVVDTKAQYVYILEGFRDRNESYETVPQLLVNGRYREVTEDARLMLPYNAAFTNTIVIKKIGGAVLDIIDLEDEPNYTVRTWRKEGYLMYFKFQPNKYSGKEFEVEFRGERTSSIRIRKRRANCLTTTSTVIFVNRWGLLEETQMIGVEEVDYKLEEEVYKRSIRDINGELINNLHSTTTFRKGGEVSFVHSTGTVSEGLNEMYEDLVLSEKIWLLRNDVLMPVYLHSNNFKEKTVLRDKTVDYQFTFKEANNKVKNNI